MSVALSGICAHCSGSTRTPGSARSAARPEPAPGTREEELLRRFLVRKDWL